MASKALSGLDPLKDLLGDVISRLEALEGKVGITPTSSAGGSKSVTIAAPEPDRSNLAAAGELPGVKAYDAYMKTSLAPFTQACDNLKGLENMGDLVQKAWDGVRLIIVLASRSKLPTDQDVAQALMPHMKPIQEACTSIRQLKLSRDWDRHQKAVVELIGCLSWIVLRAPKTLPIPMVKECLASAEFWSNRIRKDFKSGDKPDSEQQIVFCDSMKKVITGLVTYLEEFHKTGLAFNPKGISLAEAVIRLSDPAENPALTKQNSKKRLSLVRPMIGSSIVGGNMAGMMDELTKRKSSDGDSAATGLKKVTKDMQTWRKEYKKEESVATPAPAKQAPTPKKEVKKEKKLRGLPIFEYQDRGYKWVVENQTKETASREFPDGNGVVTIDISDAKQQVYIYNCDGVTFKINGKFKSMCLDKCTNCAVVMDDLISSAEVVNCKKVQMQVNGICPVFTIDKTINILVWLSKESLAVTTFTASLSSEMNVSFPDGDDQKELPIPEQFQHKLVGGVLKSEVSDLYH